MKNLFALSFFLLLTSASIFTMGQTSLVEKTFNHAYQTECVDFERYDENHWLIGDMAYQPDFISYRSGCDAPEIMMLDNQGEIVWRTSLSYGVVDLKDILLLNQDTILSLERYYGKYDIFYDDYILHILNSNGEILNQISFYHFFEESQFGFSEFMSPFMKMLPLSDKKIAVVYNDGKQTSWSTKLNGILEVDLETEEISILKTWNMPTLTLYDAFLKSSGKILLATDEGIWQLDEQGEIEKQYDSDMPILKISTDRAITKTHLLQFDNDLHIVQNTDFSSRFDSLINFNVSDNNLWLIGKTSNSNKFHFEKIALSDINEPPLLTIDILGTQNIPIGLQSFEDKVLVLGNETVQLTPRTFFKTYDAAIGDSQDYSVDIGIEEMELENFQRSELPSFWGFFFDTYFKVKNYGTDTIHQFFINYQDGFAGQIHTSFPYFNSSDSLSLAPNESIKIGPIGAVVYGSFGQEKEICLWVTGPNDRIDRDHSNNSSCETVVLSDIASPIADSNDISIFPNPFRQKLEIQTQNQFLDDAQVTIFNTLGQVVYRSELKSKQTVLELKELQSGVYIVEVKNRNSGERWTERVVKY